MIKLILECIKCNDKKTLTYMPKEQPLCEKCIYPMIVVSLKVKDSIK